MEISYFLCWHFNFIHLISSSYSMSCFVSWKPLSVAWCWWALSVLNIILPSHIKTYVQSKPEKATFTQDVISFLINWNNPHRDDLLQVSVLEGWLPCAPDRIPLQKSSWWRVASSLETVENIPTMQGKLMEFPLESTKSPISNSCCYKKGYELQKWYEILEKNRERWETRPVEGGREWGCGREGGKGLSVAFWIPIWGYKWIKYSGFWRLCSRRDQWSVRLLTA